MVEVDMIDCKLVTAESGGCLYGMVYGNTSGMGWCKHMGTANEQQLHARAAHSGADLGCSRMADTHPSEQAFQLHALASAIV